MSESKMVQISISMPSHLKEWLKKTAKEEGCSMAEIVRRAIKKYLSTHKK